ncbi:hypothetical protein [Halalkalibacter oceani]|uniref:hypothetical protein n=1 Tax=Halalkalibacter oceani TaxID=1653776 RepID=UPI0033988A68
MRLMNWFAEYDNERLTEEKNNFNDINKNKLIKFGMTGNGTTFTHYIKDGYFKINQNYVHFLLDDSLIGKTNDIINYKEKIQITDILSNNGKTKSNIIGYYTGFKTENNDFKDIEVLFWADFANKQLKVRLRLTPVNKLECDFNVVINGKMNEKKLLFENLHERKEFSFNI